MRWQKLCEAASALTKRHPVNDYPYDHLRVACGCAVQPPEWKCDCTRMQTGTQKIVPL